MARLKPRPFKEIPLTEMPFKVAPFKEIFMQPVLIKLDAQALAQRLAG
jgi:hypothetical protein